MITVSELGLSLNGQNLFSDVNLLFTPGNCYDVIGANGARKSTFLKILSGELESTKGEVIIDPELRMSVLKQDHYAFDVFTMFDAILQGNPRLYEVSKQKDALYAREDFSEEDGNLAAELETEFAEMNGWDAETEAGKLLQGLGLSVNLLHSQMGTLSETEKVKILLVQALFGQPDIILPDEPTNGLDVDSIHWFEDFPMDYVGTVIAVSHDRHFLNDVCAYIVDTDYIKIRMYVGNYDFWYESSQLIQCVMRDQDRKNEDKIKELQAFIQRFSANKSRSKQATSRKKLPDKITVEEMPASPRRYPYVGFTVDREPGKETLTVENLSRTVDGVKVLNNISFRVNKGDKIAFLAENKLAATTLFKILTEEFTPDEGTFKWGVSTTQSYFSQDNSEYFNDCDLSILRQFEQYSKDTTETYLRGFLDKMLFSGEDVLKPVNVLSGGEKTRCILSHTMMFGSNVLLLDQPTNHPDLRSIMAVNNGTIEFKGVILFVSHDHQFVQTVANRIIEILPEDGVLDRMTTYEEYLEMKAQRAQGAETEALPI